MDLDLSLESHDLNGLHLKIEPGSSPSVGPLSGRVDPLNRSSSALHRKSPLSANDLKPSIELLHATIKDRVPPHQIVDSEDDMRNAVQVFKIDQTSKNPLPNEAKVSWKKSQLPNGLLTWSKEQTLHQVMLDTSETGYMLRYDDKEYKQLLTDPNWTRAETDLLMDLCDQFDLRFIVIHDRFLSSSTKPKPIEALKSRYYSIQQTLVQSRALDGEDYLSHPVFQMTYDMKEDSQRRTELELFFNRPKEMYYESANALLSLKNESIGYELEEFERRQVKLLQMVRQNRVISSSIHRARPLRSIDQEDIKYLLSGLPESVTLTGQNAVKAKPKGVHVRRQYLQQMLVGAHKSIKSVEQELYKYGFGKSVPLTVPTAVSCEIFDRIREDLMVLFRLEKYVQKKEQDLHHMKVQMEGSALRNDKYGHMKNVKRRLSRP